MIGDRKRVLWLDNDPGYIFGLVKALQRHDIDVVVARSVSEAETAVLSERFDLIIVDVMIPVTPAEQNDGYTSAATDDSHKTGLEFYKRHGRRLEADSTVVALTVRVDQPVRQEFIAAGLPPERFLTKLEVPNAKSFVSTVKEFINAR